MNHALAVKLFVSADFTSTLRYLRWRGIVNIMKFEFTKENVREWWNLWRWEQLFWICRLETDFQKFAIFDNPGTSFSRIRIFQCSTSRPNFVTHSFFSLFQNYMQYSRRGKTLYKGTLFQLQHIYIKMTLNARDSTRSTTYLNRTSVNVSHDCGERIIAAFTNLGPAVSTTLLTQS